ncbi:hypothetical protein [Streptomyces sp. NPDC005281]|uniref:hypothetical protein n=1 Tax=Streptomyces sp. NPDC005281 TaxID=3155712 RepID=UPI0033A351EE
MESLRMPTPAAIAQVLAPRTRNAYDRHRWEEALLATKVPHHNALLLGWTLAHMAGDAGYLPAGSTQMERLAARAQINPKQARLSVMQLMQAGLVTRPDIETWEPREVTRPITLTLPTGLPHPGGDPE